MLTLAIWTVLSPWALDYQLSDAAWNPVIVGIIVSLVAIAGLAGERSPDLAATCLLAGLWLAGSALWLAASTQARSITPSRAWG